MLQCTLIGNLGGNAEVKQADGREFVSFRVAHNDSYTDASGTKHDTVQWVDCTMNCDNGRPAVLPYLNAGTMVCVIGTIKTRIYSSEKDRCMKAGLTIRVQRIELLGGSSDAVPKRLYTSDGLQVDVAKWFHCDKKNVVLLNQRGQQFAVDKNGWIQPVVSNENNG